MSRPEYTTRDLADASGTSTMHWRNQVDDKQIIAAVNIKRGPRRLLRFTIDDIREYDPQLAARVLAARGTSTDVPHGTTDNGSNRDNRE